MTREVQALRADHNLAPETAIAEAIRRLPETFLPDDAGLTVVFTEGWREHSELCDRRPDTEDGRQDKLVGMRIDTNRLSSIAQLAHLLPYVAPQIERFCGNALARRQGILPRRRSRSPLMSAG